MKCPRDGEKLRTTHKVQATDQSHTQRLECPQCGRAFTTITFMFGEVAERGTGPHAVAKALAAELGIE